MERVVSWLSGGVSSFVAAWLMRDELTDIIFIDIEEQTRDTLRFSQDASDLLGLPLQILQSPFQSAYAVLRMRRYINGKRGAPCTGVLKRNVRKEWEYNHKGDKLTYIWGFDASEVNRVKMTVEHNPQAIHRFPLAERGITKPECHAVCRDLGLRRADLYEMGYPNANCIPCVKGGMGYWNKIRVDFPEQFAKYAALEREIGATCLHDGNGKVWLDELDPERGCCDQIIAPPCGIACGVLEQWEQETMEGW